MANIIITGASSGIGFETVLELTKFKENKVIALARSADKLRKLHEISSSLNQDGGELHVAQFDIVRDDYQQALLPYIQSKFEKVDVLINNAGTLLHKPFLQTSIQEFADQLQTNVLSHTKMIQAVVPLMTEGGHIVNIEAWVEYKVPANLQA